MFIQRMQISAADSLRHWTDALNDEGTSRAWMALQGAPPDCPPEAALRISRASRAVGEGRRTLLAEAFWLTYAVPESPNIVPARLVAAGDFAHATTRQHFQTNCNQIAHTTEFTWPLVPMQQAQINGAHVGYFDELVCVWPWESVDYKNALTALIPGSVIVLVEPGPQHVGWVSWAGFKPSYEFVEELRAALDAQNMKLCPLASKLNDVAVSYFGIEPK